ncbi:MAG: hypothetical protein DWQ44_00430 [Bacteroidetes bacterium]|nr:MAG: hypothetical protein DWQ33_03805 [Bacteroidota bacterium]REK07588.1 MAG: hypothetical protein DWQ39_01465 [Bacteroidota bacterium]REK36980.1 MAG: hypothetical protein DWQ44_00430 [Bacteroidota bacterium]REK47800.1 MAG: hypothetical protein DWQ48_11490 [Bacteroidota bacterium]
MSKKKQGKDKHSKSDGTLKGENSVKGLLSYFPFILIALAFLLYANTLNHGYALDDSNVITANDVVKKGTAGIGEIFSTNYRYGYAQTQDHLYRPLSLAVFAIVWEISPDNPGLFHLINVLFYCLCILILYFLLRKLFSGKYPLFPFLICLLFLAHPVHTEVVANIKSLDEILMLLFFSLSMLLLFKYTENNNPFTLGLSVLIFFFGMLSKESMLAALVIYPLALWFFSSLKPGKIAALSAIFLIPAAVYMLIRIQVLGDYIAASKFNELDNMLVNAGSLSVQFATAVSILFNYLKIIFIPYPLASDYSYSVFQLSTISDLNFIFSFLLHSALLIYAVTGIKRRSPVAFGILVYLLFLAPVSNIFFLIGSLFADRFLFMPSLGFCIAVVFAVTFITNKYSSGENKNRYEGVSPVLTIFTFILFIFYSGLTITRNNDWKNSYTLYAADLKNDDRSPRLNYQMGVEIMLRAAKADPTSPAKAELLQKALKYFERAIELYPKYADPLGMTGNIYQKFGQTEKAKERFDLAIKYNSSLAEIYNNRAAIYYSENKPDSAISLLKHAVRINPEYKDALNNLGTIYSEVKEFDKAIEALKKYLEYEPNDAQAYIQLAGVYLNKGDSTMYRTYIENACKIDSRFCN